MIAVTLWAIYCMIASVAIAMTLREYLKSRRQTLIWALMGMASCLAWPVLVAATLITQRLERT